MTTINTSDGSIYILTTVHYRIDRLVRGVIISRGVVFIE